jgi:hypothetical protein
LPSTTRSWIPKATGIAASSNGSAQREARRRSGLARHAVIALAVNWRSAGVEAGRSRPGPSPRPYSSSAVTV